MGVEPILTAWKAVILPLYEWRICGGLLPAIYGACKRRRGGPGASHPAQMAVFTHAGEGTYIPRHKM